MHRLLTSRAHDDRGAVALLIAIFMTAMLIATAMVLDFGLMRVDRQVNKSSADSAAMAGAAALNGGNTAARPFRGVCTAIQYLSANDVRFSAMSPTSGTWTNASSSPAARANGCTDTTLRAQECVPNDPSSWARFTWTGSHQGEPVSVAIQSGYSLSSGSGTQWREESLPAVSADNDDNAGGCFQLVVTVSQTRDPGLGSLATTADLRTSVRSVTRVAAVPGGDAPAMLLLKRTGCPVLGTGSSGGQSFIRVLGAISPSGRTQPGTIHADASGVACGGGSNQNIFWGRSNDGIVAYAAPLASNPLAADPARPGQISSVAVFNGISSASGVVSDGQNWVYGASGLNASSPGIKQPVLPRALVTRKPVDDQYLGTTNPQRGVRGIVANSQSDVFSRPVNSSAPWVAVGYAATTTCNNQGKVAAPLPALNASKALFVDCPGTLKEIPELTGWETVVFSGELDPTDTISAPNARKVYVFGSSGSAINLQNSAATFTMNTFGRLDAAGACLTTPLANAQAVLVVRSGNIVQNGGLLRMCNTTVIMMGGQSDGCLPSTSGTAPTSTPCASSTGNGQIDKNGGTISWTAPNQHAQMTLADGSPDPAKAPAWTSLDGPEDLAFWSESSNTNSVKFRMTGGGGNLNVRGVYMIPNADPFEIGGNAAQVLTNAQYIASSIQLNGNTTNITMAVDPDAAVTIPRLGVIGLVR